MLIPFLEFYLFELFVFFNCYILFFQKLFKIFEKLIICPKKRFVVKKLLLVKLFFLRKGLRKATTRVRLRLEFLAFTFI